MSNHEVKCDRCKAALILRNDSRQGGPGVGEVFSQAHFTSKPVVRYFCKTCNTQLCYEWGVDPIDL